MGIAVVLGLSACSTDTATTRSAQQDTARATAGTGDGQRTPQTRAEPPERAAAPVPMPPGSGAQSQCSGWLRQQQAGEGRLYALDPVQTSIRILVFRGGKLASLGHNHVIAAEQHAVGQIYLPQDGLSGAGAELGFRLDDLVLDAPAWRTALGSDFAKTLSEADIAATRANMLKALEADQYPVVTAMTRTVEGGWPRPVLKLAVSLHGQTRSVDLPVTATPPDGDQPLKAQGRVVLRQTDFGIRPFTVLGGLLAIQDPLVVELDLVARPASGCQALPRG